MVRHGEECTVRPAQGKGPSLLLGCAGVRFAPNAGAGLALEGFRIDDDIALSVGGGFSEIPTISYAPLRGEDFARHLLSPLSLDDRLLGLQAGQRGDTSAPVLTIPAGS